MKFRLRLILVILSALLLTGCMGEPPLLSPNPDFAVNLNQPEPIAPQAPPQAAPAAPPTPTRGGTLRLAMPMAATLNPLLNSDPHVADVLRLIFQPLVVLDGEKRPRPNPAITQSVVFSAGGGTVAVSLHDGIFWEDGTPITAADIAFSIDVLRFHAPETAVYRQNVANIASHNVLDSRTLQINLYNPSWAMKYMLNFPIIPFDYYRHVSMTNLAAPRNMHPVGNGPFRFLSYEAAGTLELIANDNAPGGAPYITAVSAMVLRDISGARYAFERGLADILAAGPYEWGRYNAMGKNRAAEVPTGQFDFIGFNARRPLFASQEARAAAAYSFDLAAALQRYYAWADAAIAPVNPTSWLAAEDQGLRQFHHDPARAAAYFAQLEETPEINILVNTTNAEGLGTAAILAQGLQQAGANVTLEALPFADFAARAQAADFDIIIGGVLTTPAPNFDFIYTITGYSSEDLNLALSMTRHAPSESALAYAATAVQRYVADNLPIVGLAFRRQTLYTAEHLHSGMGICAVSVFVNARDWFVY